MGSSSRSKEVRVGGRGRCWDVAGLGGGGGGDRPCPCFSSDKGVLPGGGRKCSAIGRAQKYLP